MIQCTGDAHLAQKALGVHGAGDVLAQHLDRHEAATLEIAGNTDRRHPAATDFAEDRVASSDRSFRGDRPILHATRLVNAAPTSEEAVGMARRDSPVWLLSLRHVLTECDPESVQVAYDELTHTVERPVRPFHDFYSTLEPTRDIVYALHIDVQIDLAAALSARSPA